MPLSVLQMFFFANLPCSGKSIFLSCALVPKFYSVSTPHSQISFNKIGFKSAPLSLRNNLPCPLLFWVCASQAHPALVWIRKRLLLCVAAHKAISLGLIIGSKSFWKHFLTHFYIKSLQYCQVKMIYFWNWI